MKTDNDVEQRIEKIEYITDEDKRELVFQWLARRWNEEGESTEKTEL